MMKNYLLFLSIIFFSISIISQERNDYRRPALMKDYSPEEIEQKVDAIMKGYLHQDLFSGVVLIAKEKIPVYYKAFGKADFEEGRKNTTETKFDIGSINKDFTTAAILQLVDKGLINLNDNIGKFLSIFPEETLNKVTIKHLLTHTSGFGDYLIIPGVIPKLGELTTIDKIINTFKDEPLLFEPGTGEEYSNAGFAVLGAVIESVSGLTYFDYIEQNILNPLELDDTYFDYKKIRNDKSIPAGYMFSSTGKKNRIEYEEAPSPSGSAFSTAKDLLKFQLSFLYDNKMLSDEMKLLYINRFQENSERKWEDVLKDSSFISANAGGAPGRNSVIYSQPVTGYIIIVLANYDEPVAEQVGGNIYRLLAEMEVKKPGPEIFRKLYLTYTEKGAENLKNNFSEIIKDASFDMEEDFLLNRVGYDLLREDRTKEAIEIFKVNTELFPEVANTWDSLAEAYAMDEQKEEAIRFYKKAIEVNPRSPAADNSRRMLKKLEGE